jgi:hypothetical protein
VYFLANYIDFECKTALKTAFISIKIQNNTWLSLCPLDRTLLTTDKIVAQNCLSFLHIGFCLLPSCAGLVYEIFSTRKKEDGMRMAGLI